MNEKFIRWVADSRRESKVPPVVTDQVALAQAAALLTPVVKR